MASPSKRRKLSDADWDELQARADRFAANLNVNQPSDFDTALIGLDDPMRWAVLEELVKIDLDARWKAGQKPMLHDYLAKFPELGPADHVSEDLIGEEYRVRRTYSSTPPLSEYRMRFPVQYPELEKLIQSEFPGGAAAGPPPPPPQQSEAAFTGTVLGPVTASPLPSRTDSVLPVSGHYQLIKEIGRGHFGEVWRAVAPGGIEVAVKAVSRPADEEAARRELQALELVKNLRHPCLLATLAFWVQNNRLYIVLELADGSLRDRMKECRKEGHSGIPEDELIGYFAEAAEGLDYLHSKNVFHRDIKPDNILLVNGHAKVADFGLARLQQALMMSMSFAGTPAYMAPESWGGKGGPASDQYSLAFAYAELRQGRRPLEGSDFTEVMTKHVEGNPDLADFIPAAEQEVLRKALSKNPSDRYPSCTEFVRGLAKACGVPIRFKSATVRQPGSREVPALPSAEPGWVDGSLLVSAQPADTKQPSSTPSLPVRPGPPVVTPHRRGTLIAAIAVGLLLTGAIVVLVWKGLDTNGTAVTSPATEKKDNGIKTDPTGNGKVPIIPTPTPYLPQNYEQASGAEVKKIGDRLLYDRIVLKGPGSHPVVLVLIVPPAELKEPPFYLMERKLWAGRYEAGGGSSTLPAVNVSARLAARFASQVMSGVLPTPRQWDIAVGFFDPGGRLGPWASGAPQVNSPKLRSVFDPQADRSALGIFDTAGNGFELTRQILVKSGEPRWVTDPAAQPDDLVVLRGRSFTFRQPLTYADLKAEQSTPMTQFLDKGSPYTGFRVVVELPN
jgi:serine/threonine protein kinase